MNARVSLNIDTLPERAPFGDPEALADAELRRSGKRSIREHAIHLASTGQVTAKALSATAGCSNATAQTTLSNLASAGTLERLGRGLYALPTPKRAPERQGGEVAVARAEKRERAAHLETAEDFFSSKAMWPGGPSMLPAARVADFEAPTRRRRA